MADLLQDEQSDIGYPRLGPIARKHRIKVVLPIITSTQICLYAFLAELNQALERMVMGIPHTSLVLKLHAAATKSHEKELRCFEDVEKADGRLAAV
jgi:hypothetical protein